MPLEELLRTSDVVTLHVPSTPSTKGMISTRELEMMKPTAVLVNTCRARSGGRAGSLRGPARQEDQGGGNRRVHERAARRREPSARLDNVVLTPHYGGGTEDAEFEGVRHAFANIVKVSQGKPLDPSDIAPVPK